LEKDLPQHLSKAQNGARIHLKRKRTLVQKTSANLDVFCSSNSKNYKI